MMSTKTSSSLAPCEAVSLPAQQVIASNSIPAILEKLKPFMQRTHDESKYPVIVDSRAVAHWLPSFRSFEGWDIVATPNQTYKILESLAVKMLENLQASNSSDTLTISLIRQPLDPNVVRRKPTTPEFETKLDALPGCLYKVLGQIRDVIKFEIEIVPVNQDGSLLRTDSSAAILLDICNSDDDQAYLDFPIGPQKCIVATLELLETLKSSHISWPANFAKHIADLHTLRALSINSEVNIGIRADKKKPLTPPKRTPALEDFLFRRTLETEAFRGTPGANIRLENLLDHDDDLFITRLDPHNDVHLLVKYGDIPLYSQLKTDSSKDMVSRKLFEGAPYDTQLKCVKEETMAIALERYLLPKLASDSSVAYKSALIRICTSLTKGWFRQFVVDNFPRLAVCDKDLLSIRDEILEKTPSAPVKKPDPMLLLKQSITNLEELVVVQKLIPLIRPSTLSEAEKIANANKLRKRILVDDEEDGESYSEDEDSDKNSDCSDDEYTDSEASYWIIYSSEDKPLVLVSFVNTSKLGDETYPTYNINATLSIQTLNSDTNLSHLEARLWKRGNKQDIYTFHTISAYVHSEATCEPWEGEDIWGSYKTRSQHVESDVLKLLNIEGLTEDLFVKFIMAVVQPKLKSNGDTPLETYINRAIVNGLIPVKPNNHLWYNLWKYNEKIESLS